VEAIHRVVRNDVDPVFAHGEGVFYLLTDKLEGVNLEVDPFIRTG
jgi:hypothetical protein